MYLICVPSCTSSIKMYFFPFGFVNRGLIAEVRGIHTKKIYSICKIEHTIQLFIFKSLHHIYPFCMITCESLNYQ